jgi:hypothetical protein
VLFYDWYLYKLEIRVAQSVWCLATGWTTGRSRFNPKQRRNDFSSSLCVQTGSGAHPASCTVGTGGPFPRAKVRPWRDPDHSTHLVPSSRMSRSYTSSPPSAFLAYSGISLAFNLYKLNFQIMFFFYILLINVFQYRIIKIP